MTVSQQTPVSNCWGNNSATEFSFNFYIAKESELLVERTDLNGIKSTLENGVDYSIHEIGNKDGSYITFPLSGSKYKTLAWDTSTDKKELLTISLTLPIEQSAEYEDSGDLSKKNLELSFDYAIRLIQILNRTISRAVKVNEGDEVTPDQLIENLNESKRIAVDAATTATTQAENAQNSANIASEKANIATAKTAEVTETYNNAMADIQKDWQDAVNEIEEKRTTAESSITELKTSAELTITNGMADITANKEQSMSAIDENRETSLAEIESAKSGAVSSVNTTKDNAVSTVKQTGTEEYNKILSTGIDSKLGENLITNCLKEVPQRIKYTLENGTLTIKAGSVVIVPYGTEDKTADLPKGATFINENFKVYDTQYTEDSDGKGKFFVWAELVNDRPIPNWSTVTGVCILGFRFDSFGYVTLLPQDNYSGDTKPTSTTGIYWRWYDTNANKIKYTGDNGASWVSETCTFPFMITNTVNGVHASVDQVFNGMGCIGSTIWVDKGVKGLAPNGRNKADGSLINEETTTNRLSLKTYTNETVNSLNIWIYRNSDEDLIEIIPSVETNATPPAGYYGIKKEKNIIISPSNEQKHCFNAGVGSIINGKITSFAPKFPFRAADENDIDGMLKMVNNRLLDSYNLAINATRQVNLSSVLPNDGEIYECRFVYQTSTGYNQTAFIYQQTDIELQSSAMWRGRSFSTGASMQGGGTFIAYVGGQRYINLISTSASSGACNIVLDLRSYRKVGK